MLQNPRVTLLGKVKQLEFRSFKGRDGEDIPLLYAYIEQENCISLAEVQIKPVNALIGFCLIGFLGD